MIDFGGKHSLLPLVYVYSVLFFICSLPFLSWTCFDYLLILGSPFMWKRSNKKLIGVGVCGIFSFLLLMDGLCIKWFDRELDFFGGKPLMSASKNLFSLVPWFLLRENPKISLATGKWQRKRGMVLVVWTIIVECPYFQKHASYFLSIVLGITHFRRYCDSCSWDHKSVSICDEGRGWAGIM